MTDKSPQILTQIVPPSQSVSQIPSAPSPHDGSAKHEAAEEEPYTIKCICGFSDDDGNTIYCETCDSWQHIECYYPHNVEDALREDFAHSCVDCKPRGLDRLQAVERQKARTAVPAVEEASDKKTKRLPSKSHKKKPKPTDLQLNGQVPVDGIKHSHSNDHLPPTKRAKTSHKPSQSISSQAPKRSPSYGNNRVNGHPPSPANTPPDLPSDFAIHEFSLGFHSLADDSDVQIVQNNSFASVTVTNTLSDWLRDPDKLKRDVNLEPEEIFQKMPQGIDTQKHPVEVEQTVRTVSLPDTDAWKQIGWRRLKAAVPIPKDIPLMELNGHIGFQRIYCADPDNRYDLFTSPLPFVLFHPQLPIYIDTRREGSQARYVRRSCRPNATLETYLSDAREYHFWLVSDRQIAPDEQITIQWDFRFPKDKKARMLRVLGLTDDETNPQPEPSVDESEYQQIDAWLRSVLSEYGGCACDLGSECAFARFHRNFLFGKSQPRAHAAPKKKSRKPKGAQHTISPTSTGHATNSRAPSEGRLEDVIEHDRRSVSVSRSKPPSRDMTPAVRQGSFDTLGILTEPTDRDKRKVAMVEDSFRRMEQQQPPRKKKRMSDGTSSSKAAKSTGRVSATQTPILPSGFAERNYVDAGTSRSKSDSPASAPSPLTSVSLTHHPKARDNSVGTSSRKVSSDYRANYCDVATQTEAETKPGLGRDGKPLAPRRVVSLAQLLLSNRHRYRVDEERRKSDSLDREALASRMDIDSPTELKLQHLPIPRASIDSRTSDSKSVLDGDVIMTDASDIRDMKPPSLAGLNITAAKSPDLRVEMPPPSFGGSPTGLNSAVTPSSAGVMAQSPSGSWFPQMPFPVTPNGSATHPSPVKKKMSLSDYKNRRSAAAAKPSVDVTVSKPASSDEPHSASSDMVKLESPTAEKSPEGTGPAPSTAMSL